MGFPKISFRICETRQCPLFRYGDVLQVSGIAIAMENNGESTFINTTMVHSPPHRTTCKTLNGDLAKVIIEYERADQIPDCMISCSGCTGSIRLEHFRELSRDEKSERDATLLAELLPLLSDFAFFQNIDQGNMQKVLKLFRVKDLKKNEIILRKGEAAGNFHIVVSGEVDILNDAGIPISQLSAGDVFGEMSLLCDENIGATVQAGSDCRLLFTGRNNFKSILQNYPGLNAYFTRLLARRLTDANQIRSDDYASGMIGKLEEIPPEALFQTLNANHKTGILTITQLSKGTARCSFRQGALIKASYSGCKGEAAFYDILREKSGRFKFSPGLPPEDFDVPEIGYFMRLLMEGLQRIDERTPPKLH
ncbi:cyclic nucleotide-binding domain-containing protein [uncultured Vibrio sp.]|uniref:cyclic nucleotide-binding domain-containing protein n=1 Tax=uncultured Vibrio sp. TaxID=114054 RepID=UPI002AA85973|nr:cyclic nucleotide-binding domain-containing protein [uncultured Vibrio sp.]